MGPLQGTVVIELAGIGPGPMAGMMLADMGAQVIRIERSLVAAPGHLQDVSGRGKKSLAIDLKAPQGAATLLRIIEKADVLIDPFRPGVTERLGIGPDDCLKRNPRLIYGRMTGWGQQGPLAHAAGHDINYLALTGALHAIGRKNEPPVPPLNLIADMGGGGMLLAYGIVCALLETRASKVGQVIDAAMVDGTAQLMWMLHSWQAAGLWDAEKRQANLLDGAAHFYDTYETRDGKYIAVGAIEPQFYALLLELAGIDKDRFAAQMDPGQWPALKQELARVFKTRTRDEWCQLLEGSDACVAPVLTLTEAAEHPHNRARGSYIRVDGVTQPAPAPRFSRTAAEIRHGTRPIGVDGVGVLSDAGFTAEDVKALRLAGVLLAPEA